MAITQPLNSSSLGIVQLRRPPYYAGYYRIGSFMCQVQPLVSNSGASGMARQDTHRQTSSPFYDSPSLIPSATNPPRNIQARALVRKPAKPML